MVGIALKIHNGMIDKYFSNHLDNSENICIFVNEYKINKTINKQL